MLLGSMKMCNCDTYVAIMAIRVVEFSNGGTKLERFLPKNQHCILKEIIELGIILESKVI